MAKLKNYQLHKKFCKVCKGNGYVKIVHADLKEHIHQCWECESEGEYYVCKPAMAQHNDARNGTRNTYKFLH